MKEQREKLKMKSDKTTWNAAYYKEMILIPLTNSLITKLVPSFSNISQREVNAFNDLISTDQINLNE